MSHSHLRSFDEPLSAALRSHSEFIDNFCADDLPSEPRPIQTGWTSYFSPSYWTRVAEDTLRKLIDKHLLQPPDEPADVPSPSSSRLAASSPCSSSAPAPFASPSHSLPAVSSSPPYLYHSARSLSTTALLPGAHQLSRAASIPALPQAPPSQRLLQTRNMRTGTSWTRLGPYFASCPRNLTSSANPNDSDSQVSDSSSVLTNTASNTSDDMSSNAEEGIDCEETLPSFSSLEVVPPVCPVEIPQPAPRRSSRSSRKTKLSLKRGSKSQLAFQMAACAMADPRKGRKGGEDAYFISTKRNACGVADGVGAWIEHGIDAGEYSRALVKYLKRACERRRIQDPLEMLKFAYHKVTDDDIDGSTTICLVSLDPATGVVRASNLGDSGFLVIRESQLVLRSTPQQHGINHPYQIGANRDHPEDADTIMFTVSPGDIIVMGTDGLFDNLHIEEILTFIQILAAKQLKENQQPHSSVTFAQELAELLLNAAIEASADPEKYCPFNTVNADQPLGGKLDDITVLVAQVVLGSDK